MLGFGFWTGTQTSLLYSVLRPALYNITVRDVAPVMGKFAGRYAVAEALGRELARNVNKSTRKLNFTPKKSPKVKRRRTSRSRSSSSSSSSSSRRAPKGGVYNDGAGGTASRTTLRRGKGGRLGRKMAKQLLAVCKDRVVDSFRVSCSQGKQGIKGCFLLDKPDFTNAAANVGQSYGPGVGSLNNMDMYIRSGWCEYSLTNPSAITVEVLIYDCVPRRQLNSSHSSNTDFDTGINTQYHGSAGSSTTPDSSNLGTTPFMSPIFVRNWKVVNVTKVMMSAGAYHKHKVYRSVYRRELYGVLSENDYTPRVCVSTLFVIKGQPVNDAGTVGNVATGTAAIDIIQQQTTEYQWMMNQVPIYQYLNNQPSITTERILEQWSGAVMTNTQA